ncbi:MAG: thioredoxin [Gemmataceae bacterium]|nr:thioredoxin [Gemmata sp.]MDW8196601.1 thioredoxin [Gemmataceae bacterium]
MAHTPWVIDVTMESFQSVVVDGSRTRPVVVDFWAPWCGPCRRLGPMLEQLAEEKNGAFLLAKVNTDHNPDLAQAFQVEGIPAVFAIRDAKIVNHFVGVMPEPELRAWIESLAPSPAQESPDLQQALELEKTNPPAAAELYRSMLAQAPTDPAARVGLARILLASPGQEAEATQLLTGIDFGDFTGEAKRLQTLVALRSVPHTDADLQNAQADPTPEGRLKLAQILAARGDYTAALDTLLAIAEVDQQLGRSAVRERMLQIFEVIGPRSELANEYRRKLQVLLY